MKTKSNSKMSGATKWKWLTGAAGIALFLLIAGGANRRADAALTVVGRDPWSQMWEQMQVATATYPTIEMREVRGAAAYACVAIQSDSEMDVTVDKAIALNYEKGGKPLIAAMRVIGTIQASGRFGTDGAMNPANVAHPRMVAGPIFSATDLAEIRRELEFPAAAPDKMPPDTLPFVASIPNAASTYPIHGTTKRSKTGGVYNWPAIKDFPLLHLKKNEPVMLWLSFDTARGEAFSTLREYKGEVKVRSQTKQVLGSVPINLKIEGKTSLVEALLPDLMVWSAGGLARPQADAKAANGFSTAKYKAAYQTNLAAHGARTYFGFDPTAIKHGFRRVLLDSYGFWNQVTAGYDPETKKPCSRGNPEEWWAWAPGRWLSPQQAQEWADDPKHKGEFDRAIATWATTKAVELANSWQPASYDLWMVQLWDEPNDAMAAIHQRIARVIHQANGGTVEGDGIRRGGVKIYANPGWPGAPVTLGGTLRVIAPDVDEWCIEMTHLGNTPMIDFMKDTGKPVSFYTHDGGYKPKEENSIWNVYRHTAWRIPLYGLNGRAQWAIDTYVGDPWDDFDGAEPDIAIIYPGPFGPISSRNWEIMRRSSDEAHMMAMLSARKLSPTLRSELDARIKAAVENLPSPTPLPAGWTAWRADPWRDAKNPALGILSGNRYEIHHAWLVDALSKS